MSKHTNTKGDTTAMSNSVTIAGAVFTDPRILAIHAKAIAEQFTFWPIFHYTFMGFPQQLITDRETQWANESYREAFWKEQGDILGSIADVKEF